MSERERGTQSSSVGMERDVPLATGAEKSRTSEKVEARNRELMQTLDDAWNAQDMETFAKRHREDVVVQQGAHRVRRLDVLVTFMKQIGVGQ